MRKVFFSEKALQHADDYRKNYSLYFCELYSDTGIWSEDQIVEQYLREADTRHTEIIAIITEKLSQESIIGSFHGVVKILWRSKKLTVTFEYDEDVVLVTDLKIDS